MSSATIKIYFDEEPPVANPKTMTVDEYRRTAKESDIQQGICELLDLLGIPYGVTDAARHWNQKGEVRASRVTPGWPDISATIHFVYRHGQSLYVETKSASGRVSLGQKECHARLINAGALVIVPRSVCDFASKLLRFINDDRAIRILEDVIK